MEKMNEKLFPQYAGYLHRLKEFGSGFANISERRGWIEKRTKFWGL